MSTDQIRANDAKALLANPVFQGFMESMNTMLDRNINNVNPDNQDQCVRVVIAKQLMAGIERQVNNYIENGKVADIIELEAERVKKFKESDIEFSRN